MKIQIVDIFWSMNKLHFIDETKSKFKVHYGI